MDLERESGKEKWISLVRIELKKGVVPMRGPFRMVLLDGTTRVFPKKFSSLVECRERSKDQHATGSTQRGASNHQDRCFAFK